MALRLEVRHVRVVVAVAEEGSLVRAARRLGIPQPSLSTLLRRIERAVDTELFHRSSRGVALTEPGRALLPHMRAIVDHMRHLESGAGDASAVVPIRVGVECRALLDVLEPARHDGPPVQLGISGPPATENALLDGGFDVVQLSRPDARDAEADAGGPFLPPPFRIEAVLSETVGVLAPPGDEVAALDSVRMADLADRDWVSSLPGTAWHEELLRAGEAAGFRPRIRYLANSEAAVDDVAQRAGALALGTATSAARSTLRLCPLAGPLHRGLRRQMVVAWNAGAVPDSAVDGLLRRIRRWSGRTLPVQRMSA